MVSINYSAREVCCKIVYYGPGLSGKTTNLQYVHAKVPGNTRGKLISLATEADRTLYFDFLPINIGTINGFAAKFQLYTVPGQVYYNATRKLVLRGVDGLVFVADSQPSKMDENIESLTNLEENLREYGYDIGELPVVIQYNKRDLPGVLPVAELERQLNPRGWPSFEASATVGNGVFDTLKMIIKMVLEKAKSSGSSRPRAITPMEDRVAPAPEAPRVDDREEAAATETPPATAAEFARQGRPAAAEDPESVQYRPYPGSRTGAAAESAPAAVTTAEPPRPSAPSVAAAGSLARTPVSAATGSGTGAVSPHMAPPLRRKKEDKKRGFFKRLFGLK